MKDKKKVIISGGNAGIGLSIKEALELSKIPNSGIEVVEYNPESSNIKELAEQLKSLKSVELNMLRNIDISNEPDCSLQRDFKTKTKGYQRPYKFHK